MAFFKKKKKESEEENSVVTDEDEDLETEDTIQEPSEEELELSEEEKIRARLQEIEAEKKAKELAARQQVTPQNTTMLPNIQYKPRVVSKTDMLNYLAERLEAIEVWGKDLTEYLRKKG